MVEDPEFFIPNNGIIEAKLLNELGALINYKDRIINFLNINYSLPFVSIYWVPPMEKQILRIETSAAENETQLVSLDPAPEGIFMPDIMVTTGKDGLVTLPIVNTL